MKPLHLLKLKNAREVKANLSGILSSTALQCIEDEIQANSRALLQLSLEHYSFAIKQSSTNWRQKVSRLYYAAYNASRATRLFVGGEYSTDGTDHKKFKNLPDDFPDKATYANKLEVLRSDRNICDYDHTAKAPDLAFSTSDSEKLVEGFLKDVKDYLKQRGVKL